MLATDVILTLQIFANSRNKRQLTKIVYSTDFKKITGLQPLLALIKNNLDPDAAYSAVETALKQAQTIKEDARANNIQIITPDNAYFPSSLKTINTPPLLLFAKGDLSSLISEEMVAVIGTRDVSPFGAETAKNLARQLARCGITVISGLALGCDTAAHQGCLEEKGKTIAILAHGLKMIYPYQNRRLADEIVSHGGCLLSEYPPDTKPTEYFFVERDRLQSGLSQGVLVIENGTSGGTVHTVHFAQEQGKKLGCVKHPADFAIKHPTYKHNTEGNEVLLKQGAFPIDGLESLSDFVSKLRKTDLKRERSDDEADKLVPASKRYS